MNADSIKIEYDEDGFYLIVDETEGGRYTFRIDGQELYDTVKREIGPWLYERDMAKATMPAEFRCDPDERRPYAANDPKSPAFHSVHADIYDNREGK